MLKGGHVLWQSEFNFTFSNCDGERRDISHRWSLLYNAGCDIIVTAASWTNNLFPDQSSRCEVSEVKPTKAAKRIVLILMLAQNDFVSWVELFLVESVTN